MDPSLYFKMDDERTERKRKKDEQRGKVDAPQLSSSCASLAAAPTLPVSATCARSHLAAAGPVIPRPPQHTLPLLLPSPGLPHSGSLALPWLRGSPPTSPLSPSLSQSLSLSPLAGFASCRLTVCGSVLLSSAVTVRPVSLMTWSPRSDYDLKSPKSISSLKSSN